MAEFRNEFSWSFTRHKTFEECRRRYYHTYYGYWGGWSPDAPDRARLTYRLKNMTRTALWSGDVVHRLIERILGDLRNRELNTLTRYQKQARDILNREWMQSVEKKWQWKPKHNVNLFEHYYGTEIAPEDRAAIRDRIYACLANFMNSTLFGRLADLRPEAWKSVEKLDRFKVGEVPVFVKIDCAVLGDPGLRIYDWKTGKEVDETTTQLGCYALFAFQEWRVPIEKQTLISFYLGLDRAVEHVPTPSELIDTKDFILGSVGRMAEALDSSIQKNEAREENFPMTERRAICRRCSFREICFGTREWTPEIENWKP
ncbi:PD-(D/E)XK nuclease family protein [Candidatus Sumerlaeota bacterium]|nr:PD-(D/E)XK nuclease family protein [Candidatus Sumerlaeota bacterium]